MNFSQLKYFQKVAEEEHISRAAQALHVAQPSLSATINRLEDELGSTLFDRKGRNIVLNDAGRCLLKHTQTIFDLLEQLEQELSSKHQQLANSLVIAVSNSMFINGWLKDFILDNQVPHIKQVMLSEDEMLQALENETIDIAVGIFDKIPSTIEQHTIVEDEYIVLASPQHPLSQKTKLCFEDIAKEPFLALPSNSTLRIINHLFAQREVEPLITLEGQQRHIIRELQKGKALLFATKQMIYMKTPFVNKDLTMNAYYDAVALSINDVDTGCLFSVCHKKDRQLSELARRFLWEMKMNYPLYSHNSDFMQERNLQIAFY